MKSLTFDLSNSLLPKPPSPQFTTALNSSLYLSSSLSGLSPFVGADDFETMTNVSVAKYSFDYQPFDDISDQAKDFIEKLLVKDTAKRLTAKNALNHEWLTHCTKTNPERDITLSLTKTKLKRYVILRRLVNYIVKTLFTRAHLSTRL